MENTKTCELCGCRYRASHWNSKYCDGCKRDARLQQNKESKRVKRIIQQQKQARKTQRNFDTLTKEIEAYNREHGTFLSYGQYVIIKEREKRERMDCKNTISNGVKKSSL